MKKLILAIMLLTLLLTGCGAPRFPYESESDSSGNSSEADYSTAEENSDGGIPEKPDNSDYSDWNELDAREITLAMGMGWNLGNQLEASIGGVPSETAWGNPVISEELFKTVKQQGFSTVRIPVSYLKKIGEAPDYKIDEEWLDRIRQVVDHSLDQGLYTIINIHGDGYYTVDGAWLRCAESDFAQTEINAKFAAVWGQIAERFKDYDERLIFESMNEVFDNTYGVPNPQFYKNLNAYNQTFVDAVRKTGSNNAKRWLLIPGWNTNIEYTVGNYGFEIPNDSLCASDENRLMISVHYYDPYNFTLDENMSTATTQWGKNATANFDSWGQEDYVDTMMGKLREAFVDRGFPVIIGELGVQDKSFAAENFGYFRNYWTEYVIRAAKQNGCVPIYWDNGWNGERGFGIIDRATCNVTQPELIEAMMRAIDSQ